LEIANQQKLATEQLIRQEEERRVSINKAIDESNFINKDRKGKIKAFILNPIKMGNEEPQTQFNKLVAQLSNNIEHVVQFADLIMDSYDPNKGFIFDRFAKKETSKATKTLKERLEGINNNKVNVTGAASKINNSDFN